MSASSSIGQGWCAFQLICPHRRKLAPITMGDYLFVSFGRECDWIINREWAPDDEVRLTTIVKYLSEDLTEAGKSDDD